MAQCGFTKDDGSPCGVRANLRETADGPRCLWHDEGRRAEATAARSKGARIGNASPRRAGRSFVRVADSEELPPLPEDLAGCVEFGRWLLEAVLTGKVDAKTAKEAGQVLKEIRAALEKRDLEETVKRLKRQVAEYEKSRKLRAG